MIRKLRIKESIDLSDYSYVTNTRGYDIYKKMINGKGHWVAQKGNSEPFEITYEQARGFEPINSTDAKLQHTVNKALKRESRKFKEGYYALMSYEPGSLESGIEGDVFDIIDVTIAGNETDASEYFAQTQGIFDNEYVTEIDKDQYDQFLNETEMMEESYGGFKEFSATDWNCYSGALNFEDGSSPLIDEFFNGEVTVIISGTDMDDYTSTVELYHYDSEDDETYGYNQIFKSKKRALEVANSLADELSKLGEVCMEDIEEIAGTYGLKSAY